jgi:recombination protein RecT
MVSPNPVPSSPQEPLFGLLATPSWQHEKAVALLPHVLRLTAPNPGLMTGPGTNSYLVGTPATGWLVIDPGPDEPAHIERLWQLAGGDIRKIVCTHSHADHAPAARPLQALCAQRHRPAPPVLGLPSAPTANPASHFVPDRALADGEELHLRAEDGAVRHTLRVVHTPGHAANHLCLLLPGTQNDGLLFSGDHILNGSTTVINPPDGNMTAYLDALDALDAACASLGLAYILPAHGHVMDDARGVIARLRAHRLAREAKVRVAMQARPGGTLDDWVVLAYDDVPPSIWPLAKRSLLAHVERLQTLSGDTA